MSQSTSTFTTFNEGLAGRFAVPAVSTVCGSFELYWAAGISGRPSQQSSLRRNYPRADAAKAEEWPLPLVTTVDEEPRRHQSHPE